MKKNYITVSLAFGSIILIICLFIAKAVFFQNRDAIVIMTAEVLENRGSELFVSSITENSGYPNGKFTVSFIKNEEAVFDRKGNKISISDIPVGSIVKIEYDGVVLELGSATIIGTIKIETIETPSDTN